VARVARQMRSHTPSSPPAFEPSPCRGWRAILAWEVLPATAGEKDVENAFDGAAVVGAWSARPCWRRKEGPDERPLPVSEMNPAHAGRLVHLGSVLEPPLG
jgi:hypothetical protein